MDDETIPSEHVQVRKSEKSFAHEKFYHSRGLYPSLHDIGLIKVYLLYVFLKIGFTHFKK